MPAQALDLPTMSINGKKCYYYRVQRGDTVYGLSRLLGLSREQIIKTNPSAADGLKAGSLLYFDYNTFKDVNPAAVETQRSAVPRTYTVQKDETLFGVAHRFGITPEIIIAANPEAANGVRQGQTLVIPGQGQEEEAAVTPVQEVEPVAEPVVPKVTVPAVVEDTVPVSTPTATVTPVAELRKPFNVTVMLPLMLEEEKLSRTASNSTDFYRGFLMAVDSLARPDKALHQGAVLNINAIDTHDSAERVAQILQANQPVSQSQLIVVQGDIPTLAAVNSYAQPRGIQVLNVAEARDSSYLTSPVMLQGSIPSDLMLEKARDVFAQRMAGTTPVILVNTAGRDDKRQFVDMLNTAMRAEGLVPLTVEYSGTLTLSALQEQLGQPAPGTVFSFIPMSGSINEFNKFSNALHKYAREAAQTGASITLYGYPEWVTFRNDARKSLHDLNTVIYTRSFLDTEGYDYKNLNAASRRWFGHAFADGVPSLGVMGFDTGRFVVDMANSGKTAVDVNAATPETPGTQSTYRLRRVNVNGAQSAGAANTALYFVSFGPGDYLSTEVK